MITACIFYWFSKLVSDGALKFTVRTLTDMSILKIKVFRNSKSALYNKQEFWLETKWFFYFTDVKNNWNRPRRRRVIKSSKVLSIDIIDQEFFAIDILFPVSSFCFSFFNVVYLACWSLEYLKPATATTVFGNIFIAAQKLLQATSNFVVKQQLGRITDLMAASVVFHLNENKNTVIYEFLLW